MLSGNRSSIDQCFFYLLSERNELSGQPIQGNICQIVQRDLIDQIPLVSIIIFIFIVMLEEI